MITLDFNKLTFHFSKIGRELELCLEEYLEQAGPSFALPKDRRVLVDDLLKEIECGNAWELRDGKPGPEVYATAEALTDRDVEAVLREAAQAALRGITGTLDITLQRTLRVPCDGRVYPLPAGVGRLPIRSVDDYAETVPPEWLERGGVMTSLYQSEALWINFSSDYPFALKVGTGKINAVSGEAWKPGLTREPQGYVVVPKQPWLDGFAVAKGVVRQFVAMPLGAGYSVEEQLTGKAEVGGIQFEAYPLKAETYFQAQVVPWLAKSLRELLPKLFKEHLAEPLFFSCRATDRNLCSMASASMGLGAGGKIRQEIYADPYKFGDWNQTESRRCFVHLCNSMSWREITGDNPPYPPITATEYEKSRIPWFDFYRDDLTPLEGSKALAEVKTVAEIAKEKALGPLSGEGEIVPQMIIQYGNTRRPRNIREFRE